MTAKTVLVTGAASGMGQATATLFHNEGWRVLALDVVPAQPPANATAENFISLQADVRDRDELHKALTAALGSKPEIHAVANIAGVYPPTTLQNYSEETYRRIFDINVYGVVNVIAAATPYMPHDTAIINFASVDAFEVSPGQLFYGASKAAVVMLTKALALELAPNRIRVNGIAPGWVATPGNAATGRMEAAAGSIPLGRVAQPEEIARWVYLLSQPEINAFMTGDTVTLSGGAVIRQ